MRAEPSDKRILQYFQSLKPAIRSRPGFALASLHTRIGPAQTGHRLPWALDMIPTYSPRTEIVVPLISMPSASATSPGFGELDALSSEPDIGHRTSDIGHRACAGHALDMRASSSMNSQMKSRLIHHQRSSHEIIPRNLPAESPDSATFEAAFRFARRRPELHADLPIFCLRSPVASRVEILVSCGLYRTSTPRKLRKRCSRALPAQVLPAALAFPRPEPVHRNRLIAAARDFLPVTKTHYSARIPTGGSDEKTPRMSARTTAGITPR